MSDADKAALVDPEDGDAKTSRAVSTGDEKQQQPKAKKKNIFARLMLFFRQTAAELRKVIYPTRRELIQYTWVVLVFVTIMGIYVGVLDFAFAKAVLAVFGS